MYNSIYKETVFSFLFRKNFGDTSVEMEYGKKENRTVTGNEMTLKEFLSVSYYNIIYTCKIVIYRTTIQVIYIWLPICQRE